MCGIAGIAGARGVRRETLQTMCGTLRHRGPDDEGIWWSEGDDVGLAHRRLSIIDLSPGGHQPMADAVGQAHVIFNGEIYNYRELREELRQHGHAFRSESDTEVLLAAYRQWGTDFLARLNGMFAFALYDNAARRVLLARDRAGEKPLFYRHDGRRLSFASELKALLADPDCPRRLNVEALDAYLAFGYVPGDLCILEGVSKLPQGHALSYDLATGAVDVRPYWTLPTHADSGGSDEELERELERLLLDSVRLRLIADVPVGIMLSGGVDSSLVAAMAVRASSARVKTFTISFPGYGEYDEAPFARTVAEHFGTDHVELAAEPATIELMPQLARQYDEPIADSSMIPTYLVSRLIRREATVALGGDGGDELFGGYPHHSWVQQQARMGGWIPGPARRAARAAVTQLMPVGTRGRNYVLGLTADHPYNIVQFNVLFDADARQRLLAPLGDSRPRRGLAEERKAALCVDRATPLQQSTALDFRTYLVDDILVKVDRASMLCSLEVRAPFLDPRLIEFAYRDVPDRLRATASERKILLRRLASRVLPPTLDLSRKQGFSLPLHKWFRGDWGRYIEGVLKSAETTIFDRTVIDHLLAGQRVGFTNMHRLFALTMLELWRREYRVSTAAPAPAALHGA